MRLVKVIALLVIAGTAMSGCDNPSAPRVLTPADVDARRLTELDGLEAREGGAVRAVIARLTAEGTDAADFYLAPIKTRGDGQLELPLWYKSAFESPPYPGNPGGKSRTMVYDIDRDTIVEDLAWQ